MKPKRSGLRIPSRKLCRKQNAQNTRYRLAFDQDKALGTFVLAIYQSCSRLLSFVCPLSFLSFAFPLFFLSLQLFPALVLWNEKALVELLGPLGAPLGPLGVLLGPPELPLGPVGVAQTVSSPGHQGKQK